MFFSCRFFTRNRPVYGAKTAKQRGKNKKSICARVLCYEKKYKQKQIVRSPSHGVFRVRVGGRTFRMLEKGRYQGRSVVNLYRSDDGFFPHQKRFVRIRYGKRNHAHRYVAEKLVALVRSYKQSGKRRRRYRNFRVGQADEIGKHHPDKRIGSRGKVGGHEHVRPPAIY